ncbi:Propanoyl-CoA C-acyltransferase [Georgfuchsia toluolica]|uniref:Propanoyl-CoA C-acyltransferase n=1 Tax=Georgfuchsia toluolica TaxID=424218 RepID=A0A916J5V1_9PROT|nr:thiolase family protein [Georgfuchsia toluolica]CAG4884804.1 Propanoyl-CoA C-acyltransferase [Georgfuchsia toluolica]
MTDVAIIGIGIHPFGQTPGVTGYDQGIFAVREALKDAGIEWRDVQCAYGGSLDCGNADTMVDKLGLTGIPFTNVTNGCATGGSSLICAVNAIKSGQCDVGVVVGFDSHPPGSFSFDLEKWGLGRWYSEIGLGLTTQYFAMKIQRYMYEYGITEDALIRVAMKAYRNGARNPNAWRRNEMSYDDIANSQMLNHPLRKFMFCSPSKGSAALVICNAKKAKRYTSNKAIRIAASVLRSRHYGSFEVWSPEKPIEQAESPTVEASKLAYEMAGIGPEDVNIAQVQDTESGAEIIHMAENQLCAHGEQEKWLREGITEIGGRLPINTDGGCIANGEPIGASGLRQVYEVCLQIRGDAGTRQISVQPKVGYCQVYGAPGVSAVQILTD